MSLAEENQLFRDVARYLASRKPKEYPKQIEIVAFSGRRQLLETDEQIEPEEKPWRTGDGPQGATMGQWLWLSPEEEIIVAALADGAWRPAEKIAEETQQPHNTALKTMLANLVRRNILESSNRNGYRLIPGRATASETAVLPE